MRIENTKEVGATKVAGRILRIFDYRLRDPARAFVRVWGYLLLVFVVYLMTFGVIQTNLKIVGFWAIVYFSYLISLEIIRRNWPLSYDTTWPHILRLTINLVLITWLITIAPSVRFILSFFYLIPIFAGIVYFAKRKWVGIATFATSIIGLSLSELLQAENALSLLQLSLISFGLMGFSTSMYWLYRQAISSSAQLSAVVWELHRTLDLHELIHRISNHAIQLTGATQSLAIIINPQNGEYIDHICLGFVLQENATIEDVARECSVLANGEPFDCPDMIAAFSDRSIYTKFFNHQPGSVLAEPLFDGEGRIVGVLNVAHDYSQHFEDLLKTQFREFSGLVSGAIANSLSYRRAKLSEPIDANLEKRFTNIYTEEDIKKSLISVAQDLVPNADRYVLHDFAATTERLIPVLISPNDGLEVYELSSNTTNPASPPLKFGVGIAGHALRLREPVIAYDANGHPWFSRIGTPGHIKSLMTVPLFDLSDGELYGTLSVYSKRENAFNIQDLGRVTTAASQASVALARVKRYTTWKDQGGVLKHIFDELRFFDIHSPEDTLFNQITQAAIRALDFKIARIRLIDTKTKDLVTVAVSGISEGEAQSLIGHKMPYSILKPFLNSRYAVERSYLIPHDEPEWQSIAKRFFYIPEQTTTKKTGWRSFDALLTPLIGQSGDMIGLLSLDLPREGLIPEPEVIESVGVFASAAAWTIELAQAHNRLSEQRIRPWALLSSLGPELARSRDFQSLGQLVVQFGARILNTEGCSLHVVRTNNELELTHSTFLGGTSYIGIKKVVTRNKGYGLTGWVAATGETVCFNNEAYKNHPAWAGEESHLKYLPSKKCISLLIAPAIDSKGRVIGVITLENKRTSKGTIVDFDKDDIKRITFLAKQFAQAWEMLEKYETILKWERKGIEDDLHDLINWYHSGVVLYLDAMSEWFRRGEYAKVEKELPDLLRRTYTTVQELKSIHTELRIEPLESETLNIAMERIIGAWTQRAALKYEGKLPITLSCPNDIETPLIIRNVLLRIASGAIANAILHSGVIEDPTIQIYVQIRKYRSRIELEVTDNGHGKDNINEGYGLTRMKQLTNQMKYFGATEAEFEIASSPNEGTQVRVKALIPNLSEHLPSNIP